MRFGESISVAREFRVFPFHRASAGYLFHERAEHVSSLSLSGCFGPRRSCVVLAISQDQSTPVIRSLSQYTVSPSSKVPAHQQAKSRRCRGFVLGYQDVVTNSRKKVSCPRSDLLISIPCTDYPRLFCESSKVVPGKMQNPDSHGYARKQKQGSVYSPEFHGLSRQKLAQ